VGDDSNSIAVDAVRYIVVDRGLRRRRISEYANIGLSGRAFSSHADADSVCDANTFADADSHTDTNAKPDSNTNPDSDFLYDLRPTSAFRLNSGSGGH
jgi:hypothetical protein